jgi:hypothetical protein
MKKAQRTGLAMILSGILFCSLTGALNPEWKLVSRVSGTVQSLAAQDNTWNSILQTRLLRDGDRARTLEKSRAKIQLADQSVVTMGENTTVEIVKFQLKENKRIVELKLGIGRLRANVAKFLKGDSSFEVKTTNTTLAARGTEFYVDVMPEGQKVSSASSPPSLASLGTHGPQTDAAGDDRMTIYFIVFSGVVNATTPTGSRLFYAGQSGSVTPAGVIIINPPTPPPPIVSAPGWTLDGDLRLMLRPQPPQGAGSIYQPMLPSGQVSGEPSGTGDGTTGSWGPEGEYVPPGSGSPGGTVPPPIFINPAASGGIQNGAINGTISPGAGSIHITIK